MTRSNTSKLEPFDLEIERTFHRLQNLVETKVLPKKECIEMEETPAHGTRVGAGASIGARLEQPVQRSLMDYAQPSLTGTTLCIRRGTV